MKHRKQNVLTAVTALCMTVGGLLCFLSAFPAGDYANALRSPRNGLLLTANAVLRFLTRKTGRIHLLFDCVQNRDYLWIAVAFCLLSFTVYAFTVRRTVLPTLALAVGTALGYGVGLFGSDAGMILYGVAFLLWLTQRIQTGTEWKGFVYRAVCVALCALVFFSALPARLAPQEKLRIGLYTQIHRLFCEHGDPLPEGDVLRDTAPNKTDDPALRVQLGRAETLYLRGFVGEQFDGFRWTETDNALLSGYSDLFFWLHQYGFSAAAQPMLALRQAGFAVTQSVYVSHGSACERYAFIPVGGYAEALTDPNALHDSVYLARANAATALVPSAEKATLFQAQQAIAAQTDTAYLRCERAYAQFVRDTMLDVPETVQSAFLRQIDAQTDASLSDRICFVLDWFAGYTEAASPQPFSGNDAVVWFLEQSKCGNDAMFATAAALLLRCLGVPARYAEGYLVSAAAGETVVHKADAHVWTEYYLDGVGWVPLETMPDRAQTEKQFYAANAASAGTENALRRAEARQPQSPMRPGRTPQRGRRVLFAAIAVLTAAVCICLIVLLARRFRFRVRMRNMQALPDPEKIAALYRYAQRICLSCGVPLQDDEADALYEEALFSDHTMTARHAQTMQRYADKAVAACRRADGGLRRIKHMLWDCLY